MSTIRVQTDETINLSAIYTKNGIPSTVTPIPTVKQVSHTGAETTLGAATEQNASGEYPRYVRSVTPTAAGTYEILFSTTDPLADATILGFTLIVSTSGSGGLTAAEVWSYTTRTLTDVQGMTIIHGSVSSIGDVYIRRGDAYLSARSNPIKWVNSSYALLDILSASQIVFRINFKTSIFSKNASALNSQTVQLNLNSSETSGFALGQYPYDLTGIWGSDEISLANGMAIISPDVRAT